MESIKELIVKSGDKVEEGQIIKNNNKDVFVFEYYYEENNGLIAYMDAYDDYVYQILVYDDKNSFDYETLNIIIDILNSAEKE